MSTLGSCRRLAGFVRERIPAHHAVYGVAWTLAAEAGASLVANAARTGRSSPARWRPGPDTAARAGALTLTLVGMRMLDDVKDLDHDRVHEPDRPLVRGRVSTGELVAGAGACGAGALAVSALRLGPASAVALGTAQGYGVALWPLDRALRAARAGRPAPLTDSALAYPTQALGSVFLLVSAAETGAAPRSRRAYALVPVFAATFWQFELARKTRSAPPHGPSDYSSVLPWQACAAAIVGLGEAAVWGLLAAIAPWRRRHTQGVRDTHGTSGAGSARAALRWAPATLSVLPPLVVVDMIRGTRPTPRAAPSVGLLLALYLSVPLLTRVVQSP